MKFTIALYSPSMVILLYVVFFTPVLIFQLSVVFFMAVLSLRLRTDLSNKTANPELKTQDSQEKLWAFGD
jgi:hypothetical protein